MRDTDTTTTASQSAGAARLTAGPFGRLRAHRRLAAAALVIVIALASVLILRSHGYLGGREHGGPLYPVGNGLQASLKPGELSVVGMSPGFRDESSAALVLESARAVDPDRGLQAKIGYYVRHQGVGSIVGPLPTGSAPIRGGRLRPHLDANGQAGGDLLVEVSAPRPGIYRFKGIRVRYRRGHRRFEQTIGISTVLCVNERHTCPRGTPDP